jgi:outer membrane receptor protein involved in Fe transport
VKTLSRNAITHNDEYAFVNARVGIGAENDRWALQVFVRNLTDEFYHVGGFSQPEQTGSFAIYPNEPRTWGASLRVRY